MQIALAMSDDYILMGLRMLYDEEHIAYDVESCSGL